MRRPRRPGGDVGAAPQKHEDTDRQPQQPDATADGADEPVPKPGRRRWLERRWRPVAQHLDLVRAPYGLYGAKYIDPVSLASFFRRRQSECVPKPCLEPVNPKLLHRAHFLQSGLQAKSGFEMCFDIGCRHRAPWVLAPKHVSRRQGCDLS